MTRLVLLALLFASAVQAQLAPQVESLEIHPSHLHLAGAADVTRVVVVARLEDGTTVDVTEAATLGVAGDSATLEAGVLVPRADGQGQLFAEWRGARAVRDVRVVGADVHSAMSFARDIIPILTRHGCNAGGCHGSATGKNGFRLSLFGYDPDGDHVRLTRELRGRRISPSRPAESLLLGKPALLVPHAGGERLPVDHPHHAIVRRWLEEGAQPDRETIELASLEVGPCEIVVMGQGRTQQLVVRSEWSDGDDRDVTDLALMSSSNDTVARVDGEGVVTSGEPGEAWIMARFGTMATVCRIVVLAEGAPAIELGEIGASRNVVDRHVGAKLATMRVAPMERCSDETFIRRAHLDIVNLLPTAERTRAFLADEDPQKRAKLIDELLSRPEFPDVMAMMWGELLEIRSRPPMRGKAAFAYYQMLRDSFAQNVPLPQLAARILTAVGSNYDEPAASFFVTNATPQEAAEATAQIFLGIRLQCAQCHDHPFERWTMDDYYGFAAFFARVGNKRGADPRARIIYARSSGQIRHLRDDSVVSPRHLGGGAVEVGSEGDPRVELARWLTAPENPYFAANVANRLFSRFLGRGLVDPVDDVRVSNPATHPGLLEELARRLVETDYDLRALVRQIALSEIYQRAPAETPLQGRLLAGASVRRLGAEQLHDALGQVTGAPTKIGGLRYGAPATQSSRAEPNRFLRLFGRPTRGSSCACDRRESPTLGQALNLINGEILQAKLDVKFGKVQRWTRQKKAAREVVEELFLAAYSRYPAPDELAALVAEIEPAEDRAAAIGDAFWAVLNSKEFLFNH